MHRRVFVMALMFFMTCASLSWPVIATELETETSKLTLAEENVEDDVVIATPTSNDRVLVMGDGIETETPAALKQVSKCATPELKITTASSGKPVLTWIKISGAKKYEIWRSTGGSKFKKLFTTTKTTYTDSKATLGTMYVYKVRALGSKSANNSDFCEAIPCYATCAAPSLSVTIQAATGCPSLSWKKVTGASGYSVYRTVSGGESTLLKTVKDCTYLDTDVTVDGKYSYCVVAEGKDDNFDSKKSTTKTVTATCGQAKLSHEINAAGKPVIAWTAVKDAVSYKIYRSTRATKSYKFLKSVEDLSYPDEAVAAGKTYYYKVIAVSANGQGAYSAYEKVTGKCAQPFATAHTDDASGKPKLTWGKISGAKKYEVWRTLDGEVFKKLYTTTKTSYIDSKAACGETYFYQVRAVGSKSAYSSSFSATVECMTTCAMPVVVVKTDVATGKPVISWKKVSGVVGYIVLRADNGGEFEPIAEGVTGISFKDSSAIVGNTYSYMVIAYTNDAYSAPGISKTVVAVCGQPKTPVVILGDNGKPELTWQEVEGADGYVIYRSASKSGGYKKLDETVGLTYNDASAKKSKTYYYKIVALTGEAMSAQSGYAKVKSK